MGEPGHAGARSGGVLDPPPPASGGRSSAADRVALVLLPTALALGFAALLAFEPRAPDADLRVAAAPGVASGGSLGVRGFVLTGVADPRGPGLATPTVAVRAVDAAGVERGRVTLAPTPLDTLAGTLPIDAAARGALRLEARVVDGLDEDVAPVTLEARATPVPAPVEGRLASPLAQLRLGPVEGVGAGPAPDRLDVRVVGGACVPGAPCEVLVHVGRPAAAVAIEAPDVVEVLGAPDPAGATSGLVALRVRVTGPEAPVTLVARRGGVVVARRPLRLPLALGAPVLDVGGPLGVAPDAPRARVTHLEGRPGLVVDVYRDGAWARAGSAPAGAEDRTTLPLPGPPLGPGLWRVQVQVDRFERGLTGVRLRWVSAPGGGGRAAVRGLAEHLRARGADDRFLGDVVARGDLGPPARVAAFLLAAREAELAVPPEPRGSREAALAAVAVERRRFRWLLAAFFVLAGVWVAAYVGRRGLRASAEAASLLVEAGDLDAANPRRRWRDRLAVLAVVAAVGLAFVAGAMIVLALGALP